MAQLLGAGFTQPQGLAFRNASRLFDDGTVNQEVTSDYAGVTKHYTEPVSHFLTNHLTFLTVRCRTKKLELLKMA